MRLIDKDKFERRCTFDDFVEDMQDVLYALRDYPTVEAIPIEWIEQYHKGIELVNLEVMINDWREENEY